VQLQGPFSFLALFDRSGRPNLAHYSPFFAAIRVGLCDVFGHLSRWQTVYHSPLFLVLPFFSLLLSVFVF